MLKGKINGIFSQKVGCDYLEITLQYQGACNNTAQNHICTMSDRRLLVGAATGGCKIAIFFLGEGWGNRKPLRSIVIHSPERNAACNREVLYEIDSCLQEQIYEQK